MIKEHFLQMLEYDLWANKEIVSILKSTEYPEKCLVLLSHIISAQEIWFERIKKTNSYQILPWDEYTLPECEILVTQCNMKWTDLIKQLKPEDLDKIIQYRNTKGIEFTDSLKDIITHALNHSNYHRAQINQLLSVNNLKPAVIDYIFYKRR